MGIKNSQNKAFTMVELLSAITIVAVLTGIAIVYISNYLTQAQLQSNRRTLALLNSAMTQYQALGGISRAHSLEGVHSKTLYSNIIDAMHTGFSLYGHTYNFLSSIDNIDANQLAGKGQGKNFAFMTYGEGEAQAGDSSEASPVLTSVTNIGGHRLQMAYDASTDRIYAMNYSSPYGVDVYDSNLNHITNFTNGGTGSCGIAVSDNDSYKFATQYTTSSNDMVLFDSSYNIVATLTMSATPTHIQYYNGRWYYTNTGINIYRCDIDGSNETLVISDNWNGARGFTFYNGNLYYMADSDTINIANADGVLQSTIQLETPLLDQPVGIAVTSTHITAGTRGTGQNGLYIYNRNGKFISDQKRSDWWVHDVIAISDTTFLAGGNGGGILLRLTVK